MLILMIYRICNKVLILLLSCDLLILQRIKLQGVKVLLTVRLRLLMNKCQEEVICDDNAVRR